MLEDVTNIEDCLELLAGFRKGSDQFQLFKEDYTIMYSIARQCLKGTPLTDRQYALMQKKIINYQSQFDNFDIDLQTCIKKLRKPLRTINREKYIRLEEGKIKIRFPFKKSDIVLINEISNAADGYEHKKGSHEHFFNYTELNVLLLLNRFVDKNFKVDKEIALVYHKIKHMEAQKDKYVPGIYGGELRNVHKKAKALIKEDIGELTETSLLRFIDRRFKYGLEHIDDYNPKTTLEKIAYRENPTMQIKPSEVTLEETLSNLLILNRFPLLICLDKDNAEKQIHPIVNFYKAILNSSEQSVLFRKEHKDDGFNELVKHRNLNNWVDKNTKIVYISKDKLPKVLIKADWKPSAAICFESNLDKNVNTYIMNECDLILFREEYGSPFRRYSNIYG